ncbi:MAG TPA: glutathione S-transferase family protein [SAR86 cluster bacterium]|nr:glutathione S-transferase family protein [SAR86 cluster bacterium]
MKLYNSIGPNPHVVRMFIQELGIDLESVEVDLMAGENRQQDHLIRNPSGQMPTLELDNGDFISEITVICDFLDEQQGYTDLIGKTPEDRAETRMWTRRIDLQIVEPLTNGFRFSEGHDFFKDRLRLIPQAADDLKTLAQERITWLDEQIKDKEFICGDRFSLADIMFYCFLNFGTTVGQPLNEDNKNVVNLYNKIHSRQSASA